MARFVVRTLSGFGTLFLEYSNRAFCRYDRPAEKEVVRGGIYVSSANWLGVAVSKQTTPLALLVLLLEIALVVNFLQFRFSFEPLV